MRCILLFLLWHLTLALHVTLFSPYMYVPYYDVFIKDYFDWHRKQTRSLNECNYRTYKFIVLRCSNNERKCGGVADRLKALPFFIAAAAKSNRIFMIRWERPTKLEEFLIPNEINWAMPDWMYEKTNSFHTDTIFMPTAKLFVSGLKKYESMTVLEGLVQDFYGGSKFYEKLDCEMDKNKVFDHEVAKKLNDMHGWSSYEFIFRDLFNTLFLPSPPVAKLIKEKMESTNLISGEYTTTQYRAFYAIENKKHTRTDLDLISKTKNAINCASKNFPGAPVYFASDSHTAVTYARKYGEAFNHTVVTLDDEKEALHLDKKDQWKSGNVSDFYPTFIDLLIMAEAKCMAYGVGGFGRFASILQIDPKCVLRHDSERKKQVTICKWYDRGDIVGGEW